ncbi:MAG: hypothetical protein HQL06_08880 [Nitrospirae bacterium]|nr:hypothetical protein [Nitrospirota bacterium]
MNSKTNSETIIRPAFVISSDPEKSLSNMPVIDLSYTEEDEKRIEAMHERRKAINIIDEAVKEGLLKKDVEHWAKTLGIIPTKKKQKTK